MNILPLAFIFISLLTLISINSLNLTKNICKKKSLACGYMEAERALRNKLYETAFKKIKPIHQSLGETKARKKTIRSSKGGKINLYLLKNYSYQKEIEQLINLILQKTYSNFKSFTKLNDDSFSKEFTKEFTAQIIKLLEDKTVESPSFFDIEFSSTLFQKIYHKMTLGTPQRKKESSGYPSLLTIFTFESKNELKLASFSSLSYKQIGTIFGEDVMELCFKKELEQEKSLSKSQLEEILLRCKSQSKLNLIQMFAFSPFSRPNKPLRGIDPKTQISIEFRVN